MRDKGRAGSRAAPSEKTSKKKGSYYRRFQEDRGHQEPEAVSSSSRCENDPVPETGRLFFTKEEQQTDAPEPKQRPEPEAETAGKAGKHQTDQAKRPRNERFRFRDRELEAETDSGSHDRGGTGEPSSEGGSSSRRERQAKEAGRRYEDRKEQLQRARENLPTKRKLRLQKEFDTETGKQVHRLRFEREPVPQGRKSKAAGALLSAGRAVDLKVHQKIREVERENVGTEAAHKTELVAEQFAVRQVKSAYRRYKNAPYVKVKKLERQTAKAHRDYLYRQELLKHPEAYSNPLSRFQQKRHIKKQYAKELRKAKKQAEQAGAGAKKAGDIVGSAARFVTSFFTEHKGAFVAIGVFALIFILFASLFSSCSALFESGAGMVLSGTYTAEDRDILGANEDYSQLEKELQQEIAHIEDTHPGYDEYRYQVDEIGHNPHELISFLTIRHDDFTRSEVQAALSELFAKQYTLTLREEVQIRHYTDDDGNEQEYEYYILHVTLKNKGLGTVILPELSEEERERYQLLLQAKGLKPHLFADDIYSNPEAGGGYEIPGEALSDPSFAALIAEGEKYLGWPYVWGGSSPSTSFDCSGFVCWVYTASGVHNLPRTTAQGIYNQCARVSREDAKPGDLIFFTGTYDSSGPVSHIGIYVGDGMMLHCGSPIQYANINSSYWQQHFYGFGRL